VIAGSLLTLAEEDVTRTLSSRDDERRLPPAEPREDP